MAGEVFSDNFNTTLTAPVTVTTRPVTLTVAATSPDLAGGTFSIMVYDAGTDASPTNVEIMEVTDGSTTSWLAVNESGHTALTHASGSSVRQILTKRSLTQQMVDHTTRATTPDPHTGYIRKASYTVKGDALIGTGLGTFTREAVGADGSTLIADSTTTTGRRWGFAGLAGLLTHLGDLIVGGVSGAAQRLGVGTVGQTLTVVQNAATVSDPSSGPTCSATGSGGSLINGTQYDFAYAWSTGTPPDGGTTLRSPITAFSATTTGVVAVQAPAAPIAGLTLLVYAAVHSGTLALQATLSTPSTSTVNSVNVSSIAAGAVTSTVNTTGGTSPAWTTTAVGFTNPMTAAWDLIRGGTTGAATRLAVGSLGQILSVAAGPTIVWARALDAMTAVGDLVIGGTAGLATRLGIGSTGQILSVVSGSPAWTRAVDVMTAVGDLVIGGTAGLPTRMGIGSAGQILSVVSGSPAWTRAVDVMTAVGDIVVGGTSGLPTRLGIGSAGTILSVVSGSPAWARAIDVMTGIGDLITGGTSGAPTRLAPGTSGTYLQSQGPGTALTWSVPAGTGGGGGSGMPNGMVPIQTQSPSGVGTVTFAVPTGFKNLRITGQVAGSQAATSTPLQMQFNGDTGSNYEWVAMYASSTVGQSANGPTTIMEVAEIAAASAPANSADTFEILIPSHTSVFQKSGISRSSLTRSTTVSGNNFVEAHRFYWRNTAVITSITLLLSSGNFVAGSTITLWGESDTAPALLTTNSNMIQETILRTAAQASISVLNIPQGYRDLRVEVIARTTDAGTSIANLLMQVNGDATAGHYGWAEGGSNGAGTQLLAAGSDTSLSMGFIPQGGTPAIAFGMASIRIDNYTDSASFHAITSLSSCRRGSANSDQFTIFSGGTFVPSAPAAITSLTFLTSTGSFAIGSMVRVYGEPAAAAGASVGTGTRLRISTNQSIPSATATAINWDTEDADADNQHYPSTANLTGTVAKTAGSQALVGTSTLFTTELFVGQVISVPGTAVEVAVVIAITDATHLTVSTAFANTVSGQTATRINSAIVFRQPGMFTVELGSYLAAVASGSVQLQIRLNGNTVIGQNDRNGINASAGYDLVVQRPFQQWDYVEALITQSSGGAVNLLADERTHLSVQSRPTVIVAIPYINIQDQKTSGTASGSFTSGSYQTRTLNTVVNDTGGLVTLASNQFTLPPGTYRIAALVPAFSCDRNRAKLRNITDSTDTVLGQNAVAPLSSNSNSSSSINGRFTISSAKTFEIQHRCQTTRATDGFGAVMTFGDTEVYTGVELWKES